MSQSEDRCVEPPVIGGQRALWVPVRASACCTLIVRLDGRDPLEPPPESEADYRREHEPVWPHLVKSFAEFGVTPLVGPPAGWWKAEASFTFRPEDMALVAEFFRLCDFGFDVVGEDRKPREEKDRG